MDLEEIRRVLREGRYELSFHAQQERLGENLDTADIEEAVLSQGEILEEYPDDPCGESCLILGFVRAEPIHVVFGWARRRQDVAKILRVITVYRPTLPSGLTQEPEETDHEHLCRLHVLRG
ncbi:MAG: DUF4258 domain-containing protein [Candidatus Binatia bacterium]